MLTVPPFPSVPLVFPFSYGNGSVPPFPPICIWGDGERLPWGVRTGGAFPHE